MVYWGNDLNRFPGFEVSDRSLAENANKYQNYCDCPCSLHIEEISTEFKNHISVSFNSIWKWDYFKCFKSHWEIHFRNVSILNVYNFEIISTLKTISIQLTVSSSKWTGERLHWQTVKRLRIKVAIWGSSHRVKSWKIFCMHCIVTFCSSENVTYTRIGWSKCLLHFCEFHSLVIDSKSPLLFPTTQ